MILTVDVGTTALKAGLFDRTGELLKKSETEMDIIHFEDPSRHEAEPAQWIRGLFRCAKGLGPLSRVKAVVISGNGPSLVPVTNSPSGQTESPPAGNALLWMDRRAAVQAGKVSAAVGSYIDPSFFLPKALYLKEERPGLYGECRHFLSVCGYLNYFLTGRAATILPGDNFEKWYWSEAVLAELGLDHEKFPPFIRPGDVVGPVAKEISRKLGFGTPPTVIAGGPDFLVSILGTGTVTPGRACDRAGTSEGINLCSREKIQDDRLMCYGHVIPGYHNISGIISTSGKAVEWVRKMLGLEGRSYEEFFDLARDAAPGSGGLLFLPYLAGERAPIWDPSAKGVFSGFTLNHGPAELARAAAEGIVFAMRDVIEVMEERSEPVTQLRITGGPSRSAFLNQLKADITGKEVWVPALRDSELLGNLCLAMKGLGEFGSIQGAAEELISFQEIYRPDATRSGLYAEGFHRYRHTYQALKPVFREKYPIEK